MNSTERLSIEQTMAVWARDLSRPKLEALRLDIPFEVRKYGEYELHAVEVELIERDRFPG